MSFSINYFLELQSHFSSMLLTMLVHNLEPSSEVLQGSCLTVLIFNTFIMEHKSTGFLSFTYLFPKSLLVYSKLNLAFISSA